jgi:hypothetical protein
MRALSAAIAPLLASLLLIATVVAPAHCLARATVPGGNAAEFCLPAALFDQAPHPDDGAHDPPGICVVCVATLITVPADPAAADAPPRTWQPASYTVAGARAPPLAERFSPLQPRAPPIA